MIRRTNGGQVVGLLTEIRDLLAGRPSPAPSPADDERPEGTTEVTGD